MKEAVGFTKYQSPTSAKKEEVEDASSKKRKVHVIQQVLNAYTATPKRQNKSTPAKFAAPQSKSKTKATPVSTPANVSPNTASTKKRRVNLGSSSKKVYIPYRLN